MTTLEYSPVAQTRYNTIMFSVSGDLSYGYNVVPKNDVTNVGLQFVTKTRAIEFARETGHLGWSKQVEIYQQSVNYYNKNVSEEATNKFVGGARSGYLTGDQARKYASDPNAYGDQVKQVRQKYHIRPRPDNWRLRY